jgi:hypothetical protein
MVARDGDRHGRVFWQLAVITGLDRFEGRDSQVFPIPGRGELRLQIRDTLPQRLDRRFDLLLRKARCDVLRTIPIEGRHVNQHRPLDLGLESGTATAPASCGSDESTPRPLLPQSAPARIIVRPGEEYSLERGMHFHHR